MAKLDKLRQQIDQIDSSIMKLLEERFDLTNKIGKEKLKDKVEITNKDREEEIISKSYEFKYQKQIEKHDYLCMEIWKELIKKYKLKGFCFHYTFG